MVLFALFVVLALVAGLPLVPSLTELRRRRDAAPLAVADDYEEDLHRAPARFAARHAGVLALPAAGTLPEDTYHVLRTPTLPAGGLPPDRPCLLATDTRLPDYLHLRGEVLALAPFHGGAATHLDALFARAGARLGPDSRVNRWVHSETTLDVAHGVVLRGSASAGGHLTLHGSCLFERLHAPSIHFGPARPLPPPVDAPLIPYRPAGCLNEAEGRYLVEGDLRVPPGHHVEASLVVTGRLDVGEGCVVAGSVKAHGPIRVASDTTIHGHLFGRGDVTLEAGVQVFGVVMAEDRLEVGKNCRLGRPGHPTTASAALLSVAEGTCVHGTLWALEQGCTRIPPPRPGTHRRRDRRHRERRHPAAPSRPVSRPR